MLCWHQKMITKTSFFLFEKSFSKNILQCNRSSITYHTWHIDTLEVVMVQYKHKRIRFRCKGRHTLWLHTGCWHHIIHHIISYQYWHIESFNAKNALCLYILDITHQACSWIMMDINAHYMSFPLVTGWWFTISKLSCNKSIYANKKSLKNFLSE